MTIIDKPGFYTSKAGRCEVVAITREWAFGVDEKGFPCVWYARSGESLAICFNRADDITGPFIDKPKPIECWMVLANNGNVRFWSIEKGAAESIAADTGCRLVHLIEAEDK